MVGFCDECNQETEVLYYEDYKKYLCQDDAEQYEHETAEQWGAEQ